jgi:hypothetical protein
MPTKRVAKKKEAVPEEPVAPVFVAPPSPETEATEPPVSKPAPKKLRSKKLIQVQSELVQPIEIVPNVILHLRCSLKDLDDHHDNINKILTNPLSYDPSIPPEIMTVDSLSRTQFGLYQADAALSAAGADGSAAYTGLCSRCSNETSTEGATQGSGPANAGRKVSDSDDLQAKIRNLKVRFHKGQVDLSRRSACFWCTYDFDSAPCYIPRQELRASTPDSHESLLVYGHFCSPECAVAYLFKENIDDHTKFERFHLINKWYGGAQGSIRPAPNPYYILDRYMGTLSIQEFRELTGGSAPGLIVLDKPMTRVLPEIHTDHDAVGSAFKVRRASTKGP